MLFGIILLLGSAIVGSLAFGWIARAIFGARSREVRAALGEALDRVPEGGGAVTLRGQLVTLGSPCQRFEDGRKAAAVTASAARAEGAPVEANARAEGLALLVGGQSVQIEGPVRVIAGSREASVGSKVAPPRGRVLDRIGAVDPEVAWALCHHPSEVRLRSLAHGDRVRIAGVLRRAEGAIEGAAHGYRDAGAPWSLVPEEAGDSPALRAAFEGAPDGPREQRAAIAGAILGPVVATTIAVMMLPPLPPPPGDVFPLAKPTMSAENGEGRDPRFDGAVSALEDGDLARASVEVPSTSTFARYEAELHLLAGRFEAAATALDGEQWTKHADPTKPCIVAALRARGQGPEAAAALAYLRRTAVRDALVREVSGGEGRKWAACALLLADLVPVAERTSILDALPLTGHGTLSRLRALLDLEVGRVPQELPYVGSTLPSPDALLRRMPYELDDELLSVHLTAAARRVPGVAKHGQFRCVEAARAAHVLSALGDVDGARKAWEAAHDDIGFVSPPDLMTLRMAIELRANDVEAARRIALSSKVSDDILLTTQILTRGPEDYDRLEGAPVARFVNYRLSQAADTKALAADLIKAGTSDDGQGLFLVPASRFGAGRDALLGWVRTGNRESSLHRLRFAPPPPADFLVRLEERRRLASNLGDALLANELGEKLQQARAALLRREVAGLVYMLHHGAHGD